ncbi:MAG: DUF998 domain-containing protein [Candidatus Marsarchaeota archaeon]|nr:DUF998 domain-containing protein [Candidatus Marsarchaeota archaeon]
MPKSICGGCPTIREPKDAGILHAFRPVAEVQHVTKTDAKALKSARRRNIKSEIYGAMWMVGPAVGVGCTMFAAFTVGGFSWSHDPLSLLLSSKNQPIFSAGLATAGLMIAASARSSTAYSSNRPMLSGFCKAALTIGGLSLAAVGLSFGPMQVIHNASAAVYFTSMPVAIASIGVSLLPEKKTRKLGWTSIAAAVADATIISSSYLLLGRAVSEFEMLSSMVSAGWLFAVGYMSVFGDHMLRRKKKAEGAPPNEAKKKEDKAALA